MEGAAKTNRVQVSSSRPLKVFVAQAKQSLHEQGEVCVSALGQAISVAVTVSEILRNEGFAVQTKVETGLETGTQDGAPRSKISVSLKKSAQFDSLYAASQAAEEAAEQ